MYSLVFASDMYATVFKADPLDPVRGDKYRRCILKPGGSREELDSLEVGGILFSPKTGYLLLTRHSLVGHPMRMRSRRNCLETQLLQVPNLLFPVYSLGSALSLRLNLPPSV